MLTFSGCHIGEGVPSKYFTGRRQTYKSSSCRNATFKLLMPPPTGVVSGPLIDNNGVSEAPEIINLDDSEKFKDSDDKIVEIETRGTRKYNDIYFSVEDVMFGFGIKGLNKTIIDERNKYVEEVDYKYFILKISVTNAKKIITKKI